MVKILVAEDNSSVRDFVERGLTTLGHSVRAVPDGGQAVLALAQEPFDVLLTDIVMPVMDGIALALKASAEYPAMQIVMMTGFAHERQRAYNLDSLIAEVLEKPFTLDALGAAIDQAMAKMQTG